MLAWLKEELGKDTARIPEVIRAFMILERADVSKGRWTLRSAWILSSAGILGSTWILKKGRIATRTRLNYLCGIKQTERQTDTMTDKGK